jgi:prephenate dehydrogenase
MSTYRKVAIIGVGLIGGSIGLALRKRGLAQKVTGIGRRKSSLEKALTFGVVHDATTDLAAGVADADAIVVASPVDTIATHVCQAVAATPHVAFVTDAGSTKGQICAAVDGNLGRSRNPFVGSHPLAGDHRTGPEFSRDDLFVEKTVIITPTNATDPQALEKVREFWQSLGALVHVMSPQEHDEALAATSHLPHLVASALAKCTPQEYLPLCATGWADTTRVAAGDAELWTQIFSQNSSAMVPAVDKLLAQLTELRSQMAANEWVHLQETLQEAKRIRDALGN